MGKRDPVVVLGGGPCGLSAAWELAQRRLGVRVVDREARAGGLCGTIEHAGWRFDYGGHRFITQSADLYRRVLDLAGDLLLQAERRSAVLSDGRRFRYPLEPADLARNLGIFEGLRALAGWGWEALRRPLGQRDQSTFEGWVTSRFGRPIYDRFFGPYTQKLWGIAPSEISADWASQRISLLNLGDVALRLMGLRGEPVRTYARRYLYPRLGMGQLFERIAAHVERLGGRVDLETEVTGLVRLRTGRVGAIRIRHGEVEEEIACSAVVSTIPLPHLVRHLCPEREAEIERSAARLRFRAVRFLNVLCDLPSVSDNTWIYVSDPTISASRIQEPRNRSPHMAPPGKTSLMLELPCDVGGRLWSAPDRELLPEMLGDLCSLGFDLERHVVGVTSARVEHGYPIYHLSYRDDTRAMLAEVGKIDNLWTAGRQGLFRYVFMDAAMEMGIESARQVAGVTATDRRRIYHHRGEGQLIETQAVTAA